MATDEIEDVEGLPMEGEPEKTPSEEPEERQRDEQGRFVKQEAEHDGGAEEPETKAEEPDEEEEEPQRHKQTSKERREKRRQKERRIRDERDFLLQQVTDLTQRLSSVEGTALQTRMGLVDSQMSECLNDAASAESLEFDALQQGDRDGALQARRIAEAARERARLFKAEKERLGSYTQRQPQVAPSPGAAEIQRLSADFRADKPWLQFGANGVPLNPETAVALSIDHALKKEGRHSEYESDYWQELDRRVKAAVPHLFAGGDDDDLDDEVDVGEEKAEVKKPAPKQAARKGPAVGSSGAQAASGTPKQTLSPERVAAIKELGEWDDPKLRDEWIKYYQRYDREHA